MALSSMDGGITSADIDSCEPAARTEEALNRGCVCTSLDTQALERALELELGRPGLLDLITERCPHVFSEQPVFVSSVHLKRMAQVIHAVESVVARRSYRKKALSRAPSIAHFNPGGAKGVFFGYDFHVAQDRLGLIEINTNAGGAMLIAVLARAQRACCNELQHLLPSTASVSGLEQRIVTMFQNEWNLSGRRQALRTIAIVDDVPQQQYLYPEFLLFQRLFERHGLHAVIADPAELSLRSGVLWHGSIAIDLVYNRLTDFALDAGTNAVLREPYLQRAIVLTPHPLAHALYADKRNLALLSDADELTALGIAPDAQSVLLQNIPRTERVSAAHADRLWRDRGRLFFKPASGFGSRAAYRGDKITKRVWQEILAGDYVAQRFVAPGERAIVEPAMGAQAMRESLATPTLQFDLRNYVYGGNVQWVAARLYQGQTTNFRTPGGGFAAVYSAGTSEVEESCSVPFKGKDDPARDSAWPIQSLS